MLCVLAGCKQKKETLGAPAPSAKVGPPCPGGQSIDPNQAEFRPAISAFKDAEYKKAQALLEQLLTRYPNSSTLRVWRGDAALFDKAAEYKQAAQAALRYYAEAEKLHDAGCKLPEGEHYYMRFDAALASLRANDADAAIRQLETSKRQWNDSAELYYNLARAHCMKGSVDPCYENFEQALTTAKSLKRPRFLRSHYAVEDWIRRSKTQSEFPELRKDPRYAPLIQKMAAP
ncbi:MAG TPA: hypothetical protein VK524_23360 [Polyangiaceae bacterium]|nr:hypothetical protein [Polyangiaceae bacterium]